MQTQRRRVKAKYRVAPPKKVQLSYTHCTMDPETKSLQQTPKTREAVMYMVYLPAGHSIRVEYDELKRLGFHIKPRLIDMDTGDVVDIGGDPYDFGGDEPAEEIIVQDDDDDDVETHSNRRKG